MGQLPVTTPQVSYPITGYGGTYPTTFNYTMNYGKSDGSTDGFNTIVKLFQVDGETFSVTKAVPGAKPFSSVIIHRNSAVEKTTALFEVAPTFIIGNSIYLRPDYVGSMEELTNSYIVNRGTDNVFVNGISSTTNNIERFDLILDQPINTAGVNMATSGFLLMERGGNDNFKLSAITGLSGSTVTQLTSSLAVASSAWGASTTSFSSIVLQKTAGIDTDLKPSQNIGLQTVSGVFVPLNQLGVTAGSIVYGISVYANDVNLTPAQLLNIANYPTNTPDAGNGLDFMAGGGFFTKAILINGSVWRDDDVNAVKNGTEPGMANGLWANLVDPAGNLVSSVAVSSTGDYRLFVADNNISTGNYRVILTNTEKYEGEQLSAADAPLNDFGYTGTNFNGTANPANRSGIIEIGPISGTDINGVDFGINATILPVTLSGLSALFDGSALQVKWTTLSETNNAYFDIELSKNAVDFTSIGQVKSQATEGNSDTAIRYEFKMAASGLALLGGGMLLLLSGTFVKGRRRLMLGLLILIGTSVVVVSCTKGDAESIDYSQDLYLRIKQVDKDGTHRYSKTIKVIKP
ncbi:hypothetical protein GCM10027051_17680 [Niabella terrae]